MTTRTATRMDNGFDPVILPADGSALSIGPNGLTVYVQMSNPTTMEVADLRRGRLEIGILTSGNSGVVLMRFGTAADIPRPPRQPIVLECPFHIGLLPPEERHLPEREGGLSFGLTIVVQDQYGRQHGARLVGLAIDIAEEFERIVDRQSAIAARPDWNLRTHDAEIERFYERNPNLVRAADRLFSKSWASQTIQ